MTSNEGKTIVIGNGWSALAAVGFLVSSGKNVVWLSGTKTRALPPFSSLEWGDGVEAWTALASGLGVELGECRQGNYLREFKNKAFRTPRSQEQDFWKPEKRLLMTSEGRFTITIVEIEDLLRNTLREKTGPQFQKKERVPVSAIKVQSGKINSIVLVSGEEIACERVVYADAWELLPALEGLPKPLSFLRKRDPIGAIQASFIHKGPIAPGVLENFYAPLHREAGESVERHVWGYFSSDSLRSIWTLCLASDEMEDNHTIAKKLRRMKTTLDRIFEVSGFIPSEKGKFADTVLDEQVRFEEEFIFAEGTPLQEPITLPQVEGMYFLTDGYGPSYSLIQAQSVVKRHLLA
jgi:hypothetical protein